jgi:hypothetical protein
MKSPRSPIARQTTMMKSRRKNNNKTSSVVAFVLVEVIIRSRRSDEPTHDGFAVFLDCFCMYLRTKLGFVVVVSVGPTSVVYSLAEGSHHRGTRRRARKQASKDEPNRSASWHFSMMRPSIRPSASLFGGSTSTKRSRHHPSSGHLIIFSILFHSILLSQGPAASQDPAVRSGSSQSPK